MPILTGYLYSKLPNFHAEKLDFCILIQRKIVSLHNEMCETAHARQLMHASLLSLNRSLVNVFFEHESFYCSISQPNCDLERDLMSKSKYTLKLRTIAQTSTIVYLGLSQAWLRIWDGVRAFFMPIPIVLPPTRL